MKTNSLDKILLKTAFSCTACDGEVDPNEIKLIIELHEKERLFGDINLEDEINKLIDDFKKNGFLFLRNYLIELKDLNLNDNNQLKVIDIAIKTIEADEEIKYSEIKFFKLLRSKLSVENNLILKKFPNYEEYLEQDVFSKSYLQKIEGDYFDYSEIKDFKIDNIDIENFQSTKN